MNSLLLLSSFALCHGLRELGERYKQYNHPKIRDIKQRPLQLNNCTEYFYTQTIDHFSWSATPTGATTYQQRYFVNDQYWTNSSNSSVFLYLGNEADVTLYVEHTGLMFEHAKEFDSLIIFIEHRYYGSSQPFGDATPLYLNYLTHEQAMADAAELIEHVFRDPNGAWNIGLQPIVAFGGSYGGMLVHFMRNKYPGTIIGGIAASAPVLGFEGLRPAYDFNSYWQVVTNDAVLSNSACANNVRSSWQVITDLASQGRSGLDLLGNISKLCTPLEADSEDLFNLLAFQINAWDTLAMGNYPYPSNYLTGGTALLPAYPFQVACEALANASLPSDPIALLTAFVNATDVFNNASLNNMCYSLSPNDPFYDGIWDYQWCTERLCEEMYFPMNGVTDMFYERSFNETFISTHCFNKYGITTRPYWMSASYSGLHSGTTNVVYSNGRYDPWSSAGIKVNQTSVSSIMINDGAHHVDLFFSNPNDPQSIIDAREFELSAIRMWIQEYSIINTLNISW
jgi:lysosomal Pro-X carboxypeptidase